MKVLEFDSWDFPYASSEESLRLSIEPKALASTVADFLKLCMRHGEAYQEPSKPSQPFEKCFWRRQIMELLTHFYPSIVPELESSEVTIILHDLDEHALLIETVTHYLMYEWSSAA